MTYRFPEMKIVAYGNLEAELDKLVEEVDEVCRAANDLFVEESAENRMHMAEELVDVMHVCETALRILGFDDDELEEVQGFVQEKNAFRRRYL